MRANELLDVLTSTNMVNGDDRIRATLLTAAQVELYDAELGYSAQKSKQEEIKYGELASRFVTYLKTCVYYSEIEREWVRTDSVAKIIMSRYNDERPKDAIMPYSLVVDIIASSTRLVDHPDLTLLVEWMEEISPIAVEWLSERLSSANLMRGSAIEQLEQLRRQHGDKWLAKKMKLSHEGRLDEIIKSMTDKMGFGQEGYRSSVKYLNDKQQLDFDLLPITRRLKQVYKEVHNVQ